MYGPLFWSLALISNFLLLDIIAEMSILVRNLLFGVILTRCSDIYARKHLASVRTLGGSSRLSKFPIGLDHGRTQK
jgi:hypothetical protein